MVRKGESVGYSVYLMHRRKDLYGSDADVFHPERWDSDEDNEVGLKTLGGDTFRSTAGQECI